MRNNQRIYIEADANLKSGANSQLLNAESSVKTAELNLNSTQKNYDNALYDYEHNQDSKVISAESTLNSAKLDLDAKKEAFKNTEILYEANIVTKDQLRRAEDALKTAQNRYEDAAASLDSARISQKCALEQAESSLQSARTSYDNALAALDTAKVNVRQDLEKLKSNMESAKISTNVDSQLIAIQKLEKQLKDSVITSPIDGTVTAVYAKEGAAGSGLLFVIEDTDNLKIATRIREYDIGRIKPGMEVTIRSDSTGDYSYKGIISKTDPAALKNASGETNTSSDVEFGAEVLVAEQSDLRIGMAVRLSIEIEKKTDVYKVAYDSILLNEDGSGVVFTAVQDKANQYTARRVDVKTGMETDLYVELHDDSLSEGMRILSDASVVNDGMVLALK